MDGADHFTIFWRLVVPLSVPALAALRSSSSSGVERPLGGAHLPGRHSRTPSGGPIALQTSTAARRGLGTRRLPGQPITMALPLVVFFALQRYFIRGLTAGAVKG